MTFDVAASAYDAFMGRWSRLLAAPFADIAGVRSGQDALDVGAGTGSLTGELVQRCGPARVIAVEPSDSFVAALGERFPGVRVHRAAAEALPLQDQSVDAALAQLVVHFMADPVVALAEMRRVVRPGGVVAACVWDYAGNRGPLGPFWDAARSLWPETPAESRRTGTRQGQIAALLRGAGLREVEEAELHATIDHPTFESFWDPFTVGAGPAGEFVAKLTPADRERLRFALEQRVPARPISVTAVAWAARGTVPS